MGGFPNPSLDRQGAVPLGVKKGGLCPPNTIRSGAEPQNELP